MVQTWPFVLEVTEIPVTPGFRGTIDPATQAVPVGTVATYQVGFADVDPEFVSGINLAVLGLPPEAVYSFSIVNPVAVTDVVTLTIETDLMTAGVFALEIEATWE